MTCSTSPCPSTQLVAGDTFNRIWTFYGTDSAGNQYVYDLAQCSVRYGIVSTAQYSTPVFAVSGSVDVGAYITILPPSSSGQVSLTIPGSITESWAQGPYTSVCKVIFSNGTVMTEVTEGVSVVNDPSNADLLPDPALPAGIGSMAFQNSNAVTISNGTISGVNLSNSSVVPTGLSSFYLIKDIATTAISAAPAIATEAATRALADTEIAAATALVTTKTITKVSPRLRGPISSDDISEGYAPAANNSSFADRWNFESNSWLCQQNTTGFGSWVKNPLALGYPGSSISETGPLFMGGTKLMVPGYTGPAINVINPITGANKDIDYLASGHVDELMLATFMGTATYLRLATLYDNSGNGNHFTQPNSANQYIIVPGVHVPFTNALALINDSENFGTPVEKFMLIPSSLIVSAGGSISGFVVGNLRNYNQPVTPVSITGSGGQQFSVTLDGGEIAGNGNSGAAIFSLKPSPINGVIYGFGTAAAGNSYVFVDEKIGIFGVSSGASFAGGFLGSLGGTSPLGGCHEICGIALYGSMVSPFGEVQTLMSNLETYFGCCPQIKDNLLLDGDSITYGYGSSYNQDYPHQMVPFLSHDFKLRNVGAFGETTTQRLQSQPSILPLLAGSGSQNAYVIWAGTNDIEDGISLATMQSNMVSLVSNAKAAGYKVVAPTCLPRSDFPTAPGTKEAQRLAWNAWLLSGASGADMIADVAADPTMGNYANNAPGLFYFDGTHPTSLGYSYIAPIIAKALNSLVP